MASKAMIAAIDFIRTFQNATNDAATIESIIEDQVQNIITIIGKLPKFDVDDVTATIKSVNENTPRIFSETQKRTIIAAITAKSKASNNLASTDDASHKAQENLYIQNYPNQKLWEILEDASSDEQYRVDSLLDFCHRILKMKYPSPDTRKQMTALLLASTKTKAISARMCKDMYDLVTKRNRKLRQKLTHIPATLRKYPEKPDAFITLFPDAYPEGEPPIGHRVDETIIKRIFDMTSARDNNQMLKEDFDMVSTRSSSASMGDMSNMSMQNFRMMMMLQNMQNMQHMQRMPGNASRGRASEIEDDDDIVITRAGNRIGPNQLFALLDQPDRESKAPKNAASNDKDAAPNNKGTENRSNIEEVTTDTAIADETETAVHGTAGVMDDIDHLLNGATKKRPAGQAGDGKALKKKPAADFTLKDVKIDSQVPFTCNGCRILGGDDFWRVFPFPKESLYDKKFKYTKDTKEKVWKALLEYVKKPYVPKSSKNAP